MPRLRRDDCRRLQLQRRHRGGLRGARSARHRLPRSLRRRSGEGAGALRRDPRPRRRRVLGARAARCFAPRSLLGLDRALRSVRRAGAADRDAHLREPSEVAYLLAGAGAWGGYKDLLVAPPGKTGTHLLAEHDLLGPNVVAAHCVVLDEDEIGLLASTGTGVAHCPRSNAALGCGVAPLAELRAAGARVGVGTDSPASAPSFDFFEELRSVVLSARARAGRPDVLSAGEALELGTLGSARALGLDGEIGSLVPGKRADFTIVSLEGSAYLPWEDPAGAVVFGGSPDRVIRDVRGRGSALREGRNGLARADRRRAQREARHARPTGRKAGGGSPRVAENTMFFPRLRNQAKWAFVFLILVFGGGFVFLGVGSGGSTSGSSSATRSATAAARARRSRRRRSEVNERPFNAPARKELANALEKKGRIDEAIAAWTEVHEAEAQGRHGSPASGPARARAGRPLLPRSSARVPRAAGRRRRLPVPALRPPTSSGRRSARTRSRRPCPARRARRCSRRR